MVNGDGTKYYLNSNESKDYYPIIKLPDGLSCDQCTLQVSTYLQFSNCQACALHMNNLSYNYIHP